MNETSARPSSPADEVFDDNVAWRHTRGGRWLLIFQLATITCILALSALTFNIVNSAFGLVAMQNEVDPDSLAVDGVDLEDLEKDALIEVLRDNVRAGLFRALDSRGPLNDRSRDELLVVILEDVVKPRAAATYPLVDSLLARAAIESEVAEKFPTAELEFRSWITPRFVTGSQSGIAEITGVRTAILGSIWTILITILVAFPLGVGAALYLEEYADHDRLFNRFIQTNINNLAGVPSIIYGMLGLAIFVRALEPLTSGAMFQSAVAAANVSANGRTVLSAGLTLALLILPLIIINSQEAVRAVPSSLRQAGLGLGATKWQTIWSLVLPGAMPGIMTGAILAVSRAIGETAPIVVIGASTVIFQDPTGPFSKFTTLPIQIYQWTSRPQPEFRNIAAAAIIVLLVLLLSLNASAVLLRNRFTVRY